MPAYFSKEDGNEDDDDDDVAKYEYGYDRVHVHYSSSDHNRNHHHHHSTFDSDEIPPSTFHSGIDTPVSPRTKTMSHRARRKSKLAMVIKNPKSDFESDFDLDNDIGDNNNINKKNLEGELTSFLAKVDLKMHIKKQETGLLPTADDGNTSTTSRTTKSSHGTIKSKSSKGCIKATPTTAPNSERSLGSKFMESLSHNSIGNSNSNNNSERVTNHNDWDWSEDNWIDDGAGLIEMEGTEHIRDLNESAVSAGEGRRHGGNNSANSSRSSRSSSRNKRCASRRLQKLMDVQNPMQSCRRLGERADRSDGLTPTPTTPSGTRHERTSKSLHSRRLTKSTSDGNNNNNSSEPKTNRRRKSGTGASFSSHARMHSGLSSSHRRPKSQSRRSSSPTASSTRLRRRTGTRAHQTQRRSRSTDGGAIASNSLFGSSNHSHSLRGRRSSLSTSVNSIHINKNNNTSLDNSVSSFDPSNWVDSIPSNQEAAQHQQRNNKKKKTQSLHVRGRRSSMTNATLVVEERRQPKEKQKKSRRSSVSEKTSIRRRRTTGFDDEEGADKDNEYVLDFSTHSNLNNSSSRTRSTSSKQKHHQQQQQHYNTPSRSRSRGRRSRDTSGKSRHSRRNNSIDSFERSHRSFDSFDSIGGGGYINDHNRKIALPERLNKAIDQSFRIHKKNTNKNINNTNTNPHLANKLERTALAILVAEDDEDISQIESVPSHMLDPSKVPLSMHW